MGERMADNRKRQTGIPIWRYGGEMVAQA